MTRLLSLLCMLLLSMPANSHDIGVSRTELIAGEGNSYMLRVSSGQGATSLFPPAELPADCSYTGNPRGIVGGGWKQFEFACGDALSPDDTLLLPWRRDGIMLTATWQDGSEVRRIFNHEAGYITVGLDQLQVGSGSWKAAAKRYTILGIEHILEGYDHLLFVLALLIIVRNGWMLVKTVTAFTIAHSITLALATLGFVNMPSRPVEAVIALSIVFLAMEIVYAQRGKTGMTYHAPWIVAFGFGLLHGFGFAGALSEIGLPQGEIPIALLFFNIGVELGQLMFVAAVLGVITVSRMVDIRPLRFSPLVPAYLIGTMATYWLIERVTSMVV